MKSLLTSAGVRNTSIHSVLVNLLARPMAECSALWIPTATYAHVGGAYHAWRFISRLKVISEGHWRRYAPVAAA